MSNTVQKEWEFLGVSLTTQVPTDAASWDEVAGAGDCYTNALAQQGYGDYANAVRRVMIKAMVDKTKVEQEKGESQAKYVARVIASGAISQAEWQELADAAIASSGVTFLTVLAGSGTSRAKVGTQYVDTAKRYIAAWTEGKGSAETTLEKIKVWVPGATMPADQTDAVAWGSLIRAVEKAKLAKQEQDLL